MPKSKKQKTSKGSERLKIQYIDVDKLVPDPSNARYHSERNLNAIKGSLAAYGQRKPIVVNGKTMVVEAGNGTLEAAKALGWAQVACVVFDDDAVTATGFALADNRSSELASWDLDALGATIKALTDEDVDLTTQGWDDAELERFLVGAEIVEDHEAEWAAGMPEFVQETITARKLIVNFIDEEGVQAFARLVGQKITDKTRFIWFPESAQPPGMIPDEGYKSNSDGEVLVMDEVPF